MADQYTQPCGPFDCDIDQLKNRAAELSDLYFLERIVYDLINRVAQLEQSTNKEE